MTHAVGVISSLNVGWYKEAAMKYYCNSCNNTRTVRSHGIIPDKLEYHGGVGPSHAQLIPNMIHFLMFYECKHREVVTQVFTDDFGYITEIRPPSYREEY